MKDHARPVPGSARSRSPAVSFRATPSWRFRIIPKSTYKMHTKCIQNRKCDFFNGYVRVTYEFNTLKCLHFPDRGSVGMPLRRRPRFGGANSVTPVTLRPASPLPRGEGQGEGQTGMSMHLSCLATSFKILYRSERNRTISNFVRLRPRCTNDLRQHLIKSFDFLHAGLLSGLVFI